MDSINAFQMEAERWARISVTASEQARRVQIPMNPSFHLTPQQQIEFIDRQDRAIRKRNRLSKCARYAERIAMKYDGMASTT